MIWQVWDTIDKILGLIVLFAGLVGFASRAWIKAWIKNRFASAAAEALENRRHELNQQLEAYRGSILRDLEQFRANVDLQRSIALKMAEDRLEALRPLYEALDVFVNEGVAWPVFTVAMRSAASTNYQNAINAARRSLRAAQIFLPLEFNKDVVALTKDIHALIVEFGRGNTATLQIDDARLTVLMNRWALLANRLREEILKAPKGLERGTASPGNTS